MSQPFMAIQVVMMPHDTNQHGTIFGGVILSHIDMAGAIGARREYLLSGGREDIIFVTVALNRVEFKQPVLVGDVVCFETMIVRVGRTSITVHINVTAHRGREVIPVTEAEVVYVALEVVGGVRKPIPLMMKAD